MSDPIVWCEHCIMKRDPRLHMKAEKPVEAAKKWIRRRCPRLQCSLKYSAGVDKAGMEKSLKKRASK